MAKAEEQAQEKAPASDGRTDKEKLTDIGLSDEEVAALEGKDTEADTKGDTGQEAGEPTEEDADAKRKDKAEASDTEGADDEDTEDHDAEAAEKVPDHFIPLAETLTQEDLDQIEADIKDLKQKFDDGEIDYEEFNEANLEYQKILWHHENAEMQNINAVEQRWQWERDWYLQSNPELNANQVIYGAFAAQVNALLADDNWGVQPGFDILTEAHNRVASEIDSLNGPAVGRIPNGRPAVTDEKDEADRKAAEALRKAKQAESSKRPPETLAKVPAAKENLDVNKWSAIDALQGEAYQKAIDKLSPAELAEYEESH